MKRLQGFIIGFIVSCILLSSVSAFAESINALFNVVNIKINGTQVAKIGDSYTLSNGEKVPFSISYKGTTYLPMRKLAELLGKEVTWDGKTNTASINDKGFVDTSNKSSQLTTQPLIDKPSIFKYHRNSVDGITLTFFAKNISGKTINYYTLKISTYNPVGDPSYDSISGKCVFYQKYVGPVKPNENIGMFNLFTYQSALDKIVIDEIEIEFSDGTKAIQTYGYSTTDDSGFDAD